MYAVKNCGVKFNPPLLLVTYIDNSSNEKRCRTIPVRKLKENTNVSRIAEDLKATQRHRTLLSSIPQAQIERLLMMIQGHMKGKSIEESLADAKKKLYVDPEKNLNTLNEDEVDYGNAEDKKCDWDSDDEA